VQGANGETTRGKVTTDETRGVAPKVPWRSLAQPAPGFCHDAATDVQHPSALSGRDHTPATVATSGRHVLSREHSELVYRRRKLTFGEPSMSGPPPAIRHTALGAGVATVVLCLVAAGCGGSRPLRRALSEGDVTTIEAAMVDITSQCQSPAALVATPDTASLTRDVNALLRTYRIVQPDARLSIGALRTTPHRELEEARTDLQDGCAPQQARRLAAAIDKLPGP
jgi:hypothetical protein